MWILVLQYMTFVHFFVIALGKLGQGESSALMEFITMTTFVLFFSVIALDKLVLGEGSVI